MASPGFPPAESQFGWLDPSAAAKQMAALSAAGQARLASRSGGTSSGSSFGGTSPMMNQPNTHDLSPTSSQDPARIMSTNQPQQAQQGQPPVNLKQRQRSFLAGLASLMNSRNTPLPPDLTGVPYPPGYDVSKSPWKGLEVSSNDVGILRIAGKDVDLFRLWTIVFQAGGGAKLHSSGAWSQLLPHFDLPEQIQNKAGGTTAVPALLSQYYTALLGPFEEVYKRNIMENQRKMAAAKQQQQQQQGSSTTLNSPLSAGGASSQTAPTQSTPTSISAPVPPSLAENASLPEQTSQSMPSLDSAEPGTGTTTTTEPDSNEALGSKRKNETDGPSVKRSRLMPGSGPADTSTSSEAKPHPEQQPQKRRVEYIPFAREVDTYGGRDLRAFDAELASVPQRRPWRDHNDWGCLDIEILTLFLRSRISKEVSYVLTTLTLLSTMRGQQPGSGFPLWQCADLFHEVLDIVEDEAFGEEEDADCSVSDEGPIVTQVELVNTIHAVEDEPFASLQHPQGARDSDLGPIPRRAQVILVVLNIIRNFSTLKENIEFLAHHERLLSLLLRLCSVERLPSSPHLRPSSRILSLPDLITVRKDTLYILASLAPAFVFNFPATEQPPTLEAKRMARRAFRLVASYLVDKSDCLSPMASHQAMGAPIHQKPPPLVDIALEVFTRTSLSDENRQVLAQSVSSDGLWCLTESIVRRLPVSDLDFTLLSNEFWLSYLEKMVFALYSLAFISPPELKRRLKTDRILGFRKVMLRMTAKFVFAQSPDGRSWFAGSTRRAIETMKLVDEAENAFDTSESNAPSTLSFGMGFGDVSGDHADRGTGLLGGHTDLTWDMMMMMRDGEDNLFAELDSLCRIECAT